MKNGDWIMHLGKLSNGSLVAGVRRGEIRPEEAAEVILRREEKTSFQLMALLPRLKNGQRGQVFSALLSQKDLGPREVRMLAANMGQFASGDINRQVVDFLLSRETELSARALATVFRYANQEIRHKVWEVISQRNLSLTELQLLESCRDARFSNKIAPLKNRLLRQRKLARSRAACKAARVRFAQVGGSAA